jgi:hypothetical protein
MDNGFTPIRNGILEHLEQRKMTLMEFGVYMLVQLRADWATGVYRGCALTIAYQFGDPDIRSQVKDVLSRLKKKQYINYSPEKGRRGAYEILIHKFEPRVGRLSGTRLNAWKHGDLAVPEYEPLASETPEARLRVARESPESRPNKEIRSKEVRSKNKIHAPDGACERIYQAYPRKVGKVAALKAIDRALALVQKEKSATCETAADFLYSQTVKFAQSPAGQSGKFTPHPATFFNSGRYFDDPNEWHHVSTNSANGNGKPSIEERMDEELRIARNFAAREGS